MGKTKITTYDPRLGQEFFDPPQGENENFSSLQANMFVIDILGEFEWEPHQEFLWDCIVKTSRIGFFTVVPWFYFSKKEHFLNQVDLKFGNVIESDGSYCIYFDLSKNILIDIFALRNEFGGDASGEWCIGGCVKDFKEPKPLPDIKPKWYQFTPSKPPCL